MRRPDRKCWGDGERVGDGWRDQAPVPRRRQRRRRKRRGRQPPRGWGKGRADSTRPSMADHRRAARPLGGGVRGLRAQVLPVGVLPPPLLLGSQLFLLLARPPPPLFLPPPSPLYVAFLSFFLLFFFLLFRDILFLGVDNILFDFEIERYYVLILLVVREHRCCLQLCIRVTCIPCLGFGLVSNVLLEDSITFDRLNCGLYMWTSC